MFFWFATAALPDEFSARAFCEATRGVLQKTLAYEMDVSEAQIVKWRIVGNVPPGRIRRLRANLPDVERAYQELTAEDAGVCVVPGEVVARVARMVAHGLERFRPAKASLESTIVGSSVGCRRRAVSA